MKFKEKLLPVYKGMARKVEDISCTGCLSDGVVFPMCQRCPIKKCTRENGIEGCHECDERPCKFIENFPLEIARKIMKRTIPAWKNLGTEKFVEEEKKRYTCPNCGNALFRGARRCNKCNTEVSLDF